MNCKRCNAIIIDSKHPNRIYCSRSCFSKNMVRKPSQGFQKNHAKYSQKGDFKKGHSPHNKGVKGYVNAGSYKIGHTGLKGETNPSWKDGVVNIPGYRALKEKIRNQRKLGNGGSHTIRDWLALKEFYQNTCPSCFRKEPEITLTRDHIKPISHGGSNNIENIQPLCISCNCKKKDKEIKYFWSAYTNGGYKKYL